MNILNRRTAEALVCAASISVLFVGAPLTAREQATSSGLQVTPRLLRVPVWPADGNIPDSLPKQYVFYEPSTNSYVISYPERLANPSGQDQRTAPIRVALNDGVEPTVSVRMRREDDVYSYVYQVRNGGQAKVAINYVSFIVDPRSTTTFLGAPSWTGSKAGSAHGRQLALPGAHAGSHMSLFGQPDGAIAPGAGIDDFRISSDFRPGFTTAYFQGGDAPHVDEELPSEVLNQLAPLLDRQWNSRQFLTFGPMFSASDPKARVAENFREGINQLVGLGAVRVREGQGLPAWSEIKSRIVHQRPMLDESSPFVREAVAKLHAYLTAPADKPFAWTDVRATPANPLETEVATALALAMRP